MRPLFRPEVAPPGRRRLEGRVIVSTSPFVKLAAVAILITIIGGLGVLATASYSRREIVQGWITPKDGLIRVVAPADGLIESLSVTEGDALQLGQRIGVVRLSGNSASGLGYAELSSGIRSRTIATRVESEAAIQSLDLEVKSLTKRLQLLSKEQDEVVGRERLQNDRITLAQQELTRAQSIAERGFLPEREVSARRSTLIGEQQRLSEIRSDIINLQRSQDEALARMAAIPVEKAKAQAAAQIALTSLSEESTRAAMVDSYALTSAVRGSVAALLAHPGDSIRVGATIAVITPSQSELIAELFVPSRSAPFVATGQDVKLMFDAFPHEKFGQSEGRVMTISKAPLLPAQLSDYGLDLKEPVYLVRVRLSRQSVQAYGSKVPLRAGNLLKAAIILERRTFIRWLTDPIAALGG